MSRFRVGFGYDVHRFTESRKLWLGGIEIQHTHGLLGHSDADVVIHALCDALLGAAAMRDIGYHFPDTSDAYKNIDSRILLRKTVELLAGKGYALGNADITICAERPKLSTYIPLMQACLAEVMSVCVDDISIKATTGERMGFVGREEGIAAYCTVLITANA
jgi:2-C-methyl-D-erythritol 2,4-cyclodiphosphate synthase